MESVTGTSCPPGRGSSGHQHDTTPSTRSIRAQRHPLRASLHPSATRPPYTFGWSLAVLSPLSQFDGQPVRILDLRPHGARARMRRAVERAARRAGEVCECFLHALHLDGHHAIATRGPPAPAPPPSRSPAARARYRPAVGNDVPAGGHAYVQPLFELEPENVGVERDRAIEIRGHDLKRGRSCGTWSCPPVATRSSRRHDVRFLILGVTTHGRPLLHCRHGNPPAARSGHPGTAPASAAPQHPAAPLRVLEIAVVQSSWWAG